eukprot:TRINITY_DN2134_c0_g1_i1.p1 TRINITY_DN2134_c0_g1~~TRINITY_DN2134_c0_g1_i1.p1  ORF type:complete len:356 (-),score=44.47 TRINITY_DN2134_c0_g1_i1:28-1095(-)
MSPRVWRGHGHPERRVKEASLTINENCDATVRVDMLGAMDRIAPSSYMSSLFPPSLSIPIYKGEPVLGTWQGVYLCNWSKRKQEHVIHASIFSSEQARYSTQVLSAPARGCHHITNDRLTSDISGIGQSKHELCQFFICHTSAAICVNTLGENVGTKMEKSLNSIVPESWNREFFRHTYEGDDDMPGHVKSSLVGVSVGVPVVNGSLSFGPNQGFYLVEPRNTGGWGVGHKRKIASVVLPAKNIITLSLKTKGTLQDLTETIAEQVKGHEAGICHVSCKSPNTTILFMENEDDSQAVSTNVHKIIQGQGQETLTMIFGVQVIIPVKNTKLWISETQKVYFYGEPGENLDLEITLL